MGSSIKVSAQIDKGLPPVLLDQSELELAILNLCINARDAMPNGGEVLISARKATEPGGELPGVRLAVADTGCGIPANLIDRVVEPFFTTKAIGQGTGLGLSQVHGFAEQARGHFELQSAVGQGTTVALWFPASSEIAVSSREKEERSLRWEGHLLLVEDNVDVAASLVPLLEVLGATVEHLSSGDAALERLRRTDSLHPSLVLSDIRMPGECDGIALARWITTNRPSLPVVLMTGYSEHLQEALAAGFRVLSKPATPERVVNALTEAASMVA